MGQTGVEVEITDEVVEERLVRTAGHGRRKGSSRRRYAKTGFE